MPHDELRSGDIVQVKGAAEILATLDDKGALEGLPFMPEMMKYCGQTLTVLGRASKICDTVHSTSSRRIPDAVFLDDLRCDGSGHHGCQAECRIFWKEAWLRRVPKGETLAAGSAPAVAPDDEAARARLAELLGRNIKRQDDIYACQVTDLYQASKHLRTLDPRPYIREYTSGNVPLGRFLKVVTKAAVREPLRKIGIWTEGPMPGTRKGKVADDMLDLQPGDRVQVKSKEEILATLNAKGKNRGLWFDVEMLPFCGGTFTVKKRVNRIIDDRNGKMITINSDCVMLEDVVCTGDNSVGRWFCSRAIIPYWRECWLRKVS